jgi:hypothetical protein
MSTTISTRALATTAISGVLTFVTVVVSLHIVQAGAYHPLSEAVSELALGRGGWLMFVAFSALATGTLCAAAMLRRTTQSRAVPILLAVAGGLSYVSAVFHADGEHAGTTLHGEIHQTAGIVTFILIVAAMFAGAHTFRRDERWTSLTSATLACATVAVVAFFLTPAVGGAYFGLVQRVFLADALGWLLLVAIHGRRLAVYGHERSPEPGVLAGT